MSLNTVLSARTSLPLSSNRANTESRSTPHRSLTTLRKAEHGRSVQCAASFMSV